MHQRPWPDQPKSTLRGTTCCFSGRCTMRSIALPNELRTRAWSCRVFGRYGACPVALGVRGRTAPSCSWGASQRVTLLAKSMIRPEDARNPVRHRGSEQGCPPSIAVQIAALEFANGVRECSKSYAKAVCIAATQPAAAPDFVSRESKPALSGPHNFAHPASALESQADSGWNRRQNRRYGK